MSAPGGPVGNTKSSKDNRLWRNTIQRAIAQGDADRLRRIAEALLDKAADGDMAAIRELGDRLDGKTAQQIIVQGDDEGGPVRQSITVTFVDGNIG